VTTFSPTAVCNPAESTSHLDRRAVVLGVGLLLAATACARSEPAPSRTESARTTLSLLREVRARHRVIDATNTRARDYIGPDACGRCHPDEHARWSASLHRVMNARVDVPGAANVVLGDFADARVRDGDREARFFRERGAYLVELRDGARAAPSRFRVTRTIGRRGLQEYVGVAIDLATGAELDGGVEVRLPFAWWPRRAGWYAQPYVDPWVDDARFDAFAAPHELWAERCPWCHSTYPFELRIERARATGVGHGHEQAYAGDAAPAVPIANASARDRLAVEQQVTTGISCESCHLGGRAHEAGAPIHLVPQPPGGAIATTAFAQEARDADVVDTTCAQCHSGPSPRLADHTALRNSSEAIDLAASPCRGVRCTHCHDPHRADSRGDEARTIAACIGCHTALADRAAATSHGGAGHAAGAASCLDCHMPKLVMGIDRYVRTHRISSPTDRALVAAAAPNACNLCHLDRSIAWTAHELTAWDVHLAPTAAWQRAYGDLDAPVGERWLASPTPAIRLLAQAAYARSPLAKLALPAMFAALDDDRPNVRAWTAFALEDALHRAIPVSELDVRLPREQRRAQIAALRR